MYSENSNYRSPSNLTQTERRRDYVTRARVNHRVMSGIAAKLPDGPAKAAALQDVMRLAQEVSAALVRQAAAAVISDGRWPDGYTC